jgi:hypothetical protein
MGKASFSEINAKHWKPDCELPVPNIGFGTNRNNPAVIGADIITSEKFTHDI